MMIDVPAGEERLQSFNDTSGADGVGGTNDSERSHWRRSF